MAHNKLDDVNFGHIAAEEEADALRDYFLETSQYNDLVRNDKAFIVIGRKGSGKSAIYLNLRDSFSKQSDASVIALQLESYNWPLHNKIVDETGAAQRSFVASWTYLMLSQLASQLLGYRSYLINTKVWDHNWWLWWVDANRRKLRRYMVLTHGKIAPAVNEVFTEKLRKITKLQVGPVSVEANDNKSYQILRDSIVEGRKILQDLVLKVLSKHRTYFIYLTS